jgi:hypothetical protein
MHNGWRYHPRISGVNFDCRLAKWKTCKCPAWDERNIINAPQPQVIQAPVAQLPTPNPVSVLQPNPPAAPVPIPPQNPRPDPVQTALARVNQAPPVYAQQAAQPRLPENHCDNVGHDFQRLLGVLFLQPQRDPNFAPKSYDGGNNANKNTCQFFSVSLRID